jgi:hypothetical protein
MVDVSYMSDSFWRSLCGEVSYLLCQLHCGKVVPCFFYVLMRLQRLVDAQFTMNAAAMEVVEAPGRRNEAGMDFTIREGRWLGSGDPKKYGSN